MAQHRLISSHGALEARLRRATGGTSHRRPSPRTPGARQFTALALAGVVAGGVAATTVDWDPLGEIAGYRAPADGGPERPSAGVSDASTARDTPAPTPAPAVPAPEPDAVDAAPVWRAEGPDDFRSTPWNTVRTEPPRMEDGTMRFAVTGPGQRTELEPTLPEMQEGDEYYFAFSVRLDEDFPAQGSSRQVITQWKNDNPGSAPVDLRVRNGRLVLHGGYGHPCGPETFTRDVGPAPVGRWSDVVVRVRFSADPERGSVSAWQDGEQEVQRFQPPGGTLYPGQRSYLKTGLNREPMITRPAEVAFRNWTVGPTLDSVR